MEYILTDEGSDKGYVIEKYNNKIYVTFWVQKNLCQHPECIECSDYNEKNMYYNSIESLYEKSKMFVNSQLINYSLLHQSQYKMMTDFITYYETTHSH